MAQIVGKGLLETVAAERPPTPKAKRRERSGAFDLAAWIEEHEVPIKREGAWNRDGYRWVLEECPWNGHTDNSCYIVRFENGAISAGCHHSSCQGRSWRDLRAHYEGSSSSSSPPIPSGGDDALPPLRSVVFAEMPPPPNKRPFVIRDLLPAGHPAIFYGDGGTAKSLLALSVAHAIARKDGDWMGFEIEQPGPVYYIDFELDEEEMHRRARHLALGRDTSGGGVPPKDLHYLCGVGYPTQEVLEFAFGECLGLGTKLVVLDSMGFALQGDAEAMKDVMNFFRTHVQPFQAAGISVLIVDHQSKMQSGDSYHAKSPFGSVYKRNNIRSEVQVEPTGRRDNELTIRLRHQKVNFGPKFNPFEVRIAFSEAWVRLERLELDSADLAAEGSLSAPDKIHMALAEGPSYPEDIAEATNLALGTVQNAITKLKKQGVVEPTGEKRGNAQEVRLTDAGASSPSYGTRGSDGDDGIPEGLPILVDDLKDKDDAPSGIPGGGGGA